MAQGADLATVQASKFNPNIESDLDTLACTGSCHQTGGGGAGVLLLQPNNAQANYTPFSNISKTGAQSIALTHGLPGSGHGGGTYFPLGTNDPLYKKWLAWINAGAPL
jgi:hypothetical protein